MWLGVTTTVSKEVKKYRIANLLNIKGAKSENASGRGVIVTDYLKSPLCFPEYVKEKLENGQIFHGYNFVGIELR